MSTPPINGRGDLSNDESHGRHRAEAGEKLPWRRRPRAPLDSALHRVYLTALFVVGTLLFGGGSAILSGPSGASRAGGVLALGVGLVLTSIAVLHLRRPVVR